MRPELRDAIYAAAFVADLNRILATGMEVDDSALLSCHGWASGAVVMAERAQALASGKNVSPEG